MYDRSGKKGRFIAPAVYRATMPKWLYSSSSRLGRIALGLSPDGVQRADTRVAQPGKDELARDAGGHHLVVHEVRGEATKCQVAPLLANDLVAGRETNQVREALDRDRVAVAHDLGHGVAHRRDLAVTHVAMIAGQKEEEPLSRLPFAQPPEGCQTRVT